MTAAEQARRAWKGWRSERTVQALVRDACVPATDEAHRFHAWWEHRAWVRLLAAWGDLDGEVRRADRA